MYSKYHSLFSEMGFPQLDVIEYEDGEWAIIEYLSSTVIPSLCKWNVILSGLRHMEISRGFIENYLRAQINERDCYRELDEIRKARDVLSKEEVDERADRVATMATALVKRTPSVYERIAKNGLSALNLQNIAQHIPR